MQRSMLTARVRQIVEESGLSASQLARESGIHRDTLGHWLNGFAAPQRRSLLQLADALEAQGRPRMKRLAKEIRQIAKGWEEPPRRRYGDF